MENGENRRTDTINWQGAWGVLLDRVAFPVLTLLLGGVVGELYYIHGVMANNRFAYFDPMIAAQAQSTKDRAVMLEKLAEIQTQLSEESADRRQLDSLAAKTWDQNVQMQNDIHLHDQFAREMFQRLVGIGEHLNGGDPPKHKHSR